MDLQAAEPLTSVWSILGCFCTMRLMFRMTT